MVKYDKNILWGKPSCELLALTLKQQTVLMY